MRTPVVPTADPADRKSTDESVCTGLAGTDAGDAHGEARKDAKAAEAARLARVWLGDPHDVVQSPQYRPVRADEATGEGGAVDEEVWLLGQPPLRSYLRFVREKVVGGAEMNRVSLAEEWRAANDYYFGLEKSEAGLADEVACLDLAPGLAPLVEDVRADPRFRQTFDTLPSRFAMVELDKLVVYQTQVTRPFVEALMARLGPAPAPDELFRFCMPLGRPDASLRVRPMGSRRFVFSSRSTDLRFHESAIFRADQIQDYETFGPIGGVVGLVVGFGANFLNAIQSDDRLVLNNGYHRACAMRALGITHAPCVVQTAIRRDDLDVIGNRDLVEDPAFYFKAARPPLLKDFFDPRIRKSLPARRVLRMIEVNFEIREFQVVE